MRIIAIILSWLVLALPCQAQMTTVGAGGSGKKATPASLSLDGNAVDSTASLAVLAPTLTTTKTNDVVLVLISVQSGSAIVSVTSPHLTFTQRATANRFSAQRCYVYYAVASSTLTSEVITVTFPGAVTGMANAVAINGANTSAPFDPNAALPNVVGTGGAGGAYASVTTTNANTLPYSIVYDSTDYPLSPTQGSGLTLLQSARGGMSEYKIVSAPQSALSMSASVAAANIDCAIGDAVTQ